jgi:hypothetical protein
MIFGFYSVNFSNLFANVIAVFTAGIQSPVSMASFTIAFPEITNKSHVAYSPFVS